MKKLIEQFQLQHLFQEFSLGIEKESQRVDSEGRLASTDHPAQLGSRTFHPYIQTDFAESQMELITPVTTSVQEALNWLSALHEVAQRSLDEGERLWPLSMPGMFPAEEDVRVAQLENQKEVAYREHLVKVYGNRKQLVCGIHLNIGFSKEFFAKVFLALQLHTAEQQREWQNEFYFRQAKNFLRYEWLLTYLFGATPMATEGYAANLPEMPVRSIRNSSFGYTNLSNICVDYSSLASYRRSVEKYVACGELMLEKELYESVRLRGIAQLSALDEQAIQYLEFRSFDLNPYAAYGITEEDLAFIVAFSKWLVWIDENPTQAEILEAKQFKEQVALQHPTEALPESLQVSAIEVLTSMQDMVRQLQMPNTKELVDIIKHKIPLVQQADETLAARLMEEASLLVCGNYLSQEYFDLAWYEPFSLKGFLDLELSTQILMFDAIQQGVTVEILDAKDQFLQLSFDGKTEFVKNGNMTSQDSVSSMLAMANKTVTKKILQQVGIHVPQGIELTDVTQAAFVWPSVQGRPTVVKPKTTNYGLGISILKENQSKDDFIEAVTLAFKEDKQILIEEFIEGTEYRFFVMNGKTQAVLLRKPANVEADGIHSIRELVERKNQNPMRGYGHQYPLTKIDQGAIETLALKQQGYQWTSVPKAGEIIYLRENSNISTGGDSIDMTDVMDESYKKIAELAAVALQTTITGVDLLILDYTKPALVQDFGQYGIIEANFNPAMMMHIYPAQGTGRRLTMLVLKELFPTLAMDDNNK